MRFAYILCCILLVILAIILALVALRAFARRPQDITLGGYESPLNFDDVSYACYRSLKEYIAELTFDGAGKLIDPVGNIERYLSALYDVKSVSVPEDIKNDSSIEYKKLYALVDKVVRENKFADKNDFIYNSGICYARFVPKEVAEKVRESYKHEIFDKSDVKYMLENAISPLSLYGDEMDHWMSRLKVLSRLYHKYKQSALKKATKGAKTVSALVKALPAGEASFELDSGAFQALIYQFAKEIKLRQDLVKVRQGNMAQSLASIDLLTAWRQDPYLVRRFINRIKREIQEIEARRDFYSVIDPLSRSLYDDLIEEERKERELRRARERQIQRDLERERLEKERLRKRFMEEGVSMKEPPPARPRIPTPGDKSGLAKKPYEVAEIPPFRGREFPPKADRRLASAPFG